MLNRAAPNGIDTHGSCVWMRAIINSMFSEKHSIYLKSVVCVGAQKKPNVLLHSAPDILDNEDTWLLQKVLLLLVLIHFIF
jgi:hypothetical protein